MSEADSGPLARSLRWTTRDITRPLIGACGRFWWVAKPLIEAKARAQQGERTDLRPNSDESPEPVRTDTELAKIAGVGKDTVRKVEKIKETAAPELLAAVRAGEVSIHAAADIATLAPERQAAVVASGSVSQAAKEIRALRAARAMYISREA